MKINIDNIEVKIRILDKGETLAQAELIVFDVIEIKGWRVSNSKTINEKLSAQIWIQPPTYRRGFEYKPIAFINDKNLYEQLEKKIYEKYLEAKKGDVSNDIPF